MLPSRKDQATQSLALDAHHVIGRLDKYCAELKVREHAFDSLARRGGRENKHRERQEGYSVEHKNFSFHSCSPFLF